MYTQRKEKTALWDSDLAARVRRQQNVIKVSVHELHQESFIGSVNGPVNTFISP
jgi:hypothetical protein